MSAPAWFDEKTYFNNKLLLEQAKDPSLTSQQLADALRAAGFPTDSDGLYEHFVQFGNAEGVSPNGYFDVDTYLANKAALENTTVDAVKQALDSLGLSAWDHYTLAGAAEGLNPSAGFDTNAYLQAKVELEKPNNPDLTVADVEKAMADLGINPLEHFLLYGLAEGVNYTPGQYPAVPDIPGEDTPGETYDLTTGWDKLTGTAGDDSFNAEIGALQAQDKIDGGDGNDTLHAYLGLQEGSYAINPSISNVENVLFTVQGSANNGGGDNLTQSSIDFDRVDLADGQTLSLGSVNSRGHLSIEDVRHNSNESVIVFQDADPEVGLEVYFDSKHITANDSVTTGNLYLQLIDTVGAAEANAAGTDVEHGALRDNPYTGFQFSLNGNTYTVNFGTYNSTNDETPTYQELADLIQKAIDSDATLSKLGITVTLGNSFDAVVGIGSHAGETVTGTQIVLTTEQGALGQGNWIAANGLPSTNSTSATMENPSSTDCPLTSTTVHLSGAGRVDFEDSASCLPNLIKGSSAGDVVVGSMAAINGVERFDVKVDESSWISGLFSTNNSLRMVTVASTDIDGDGMAENGDLYIGDWNGRDDLAGAGANGNDVKMTWSDAASLLEADTDAIVNDNNAGSGLIDVAVFDAAGYEGNINIAANITAASYEKYLKQVDGNEEGVGNPPVDGYNGFAYNTGNGNDVVNMTVDGAIAADNDFNLNISTGAGDDLVAFRYEGMQGNQSIDQKNLKNVNIDTGDGNDTVWFYGDEGGSAVINAGAGNDVIYANQQEPFTGGASGEQLFPALYNAVFVFNTNATEVGLGNAYYGATLSNDLAIGATTFAVTDAPAGASVRVTVDFLGIQASVDVAVSSNNTVTADAINQAIMKAIADDPELGALLSAKDGAGHGLIIESKINGQYTVEDLNISFAVVDGSGNAATAGSTAALDQWYATKFGTDASGAEFTGNNSTTSQVIVDGGAGDDVIVLGPNGNLVDYVNQSGGNDTLIGFTANDKINLVNVLDSGAAYIADAKALNNNGVSVVKAHAQAGNHIFTAEEIGKLGLGFAAGQASGAKAVVYVLDEGCSHTYTVVQVTNNGSSVSTSILGSLTLDDKAPELGADSFIWSKNPVLQGDTVDNVVDGSSVATGTAFNDTFNNITAAVSGVPFKGLGGDDAFNVDATGSVSGFTIDGGADKDTVNVLQNGGASFSILNVEALNMANTGADTVTITGATTGLKVSADATDMLMIAAAAESIDIADLGVAESLTVTAVKDLSVVAGAAANLTVDAAAATGVVTIDASKVTTTTNLTGGKDDDTFTLGAAKDTIHFAADAGMDTIKGFEAGAGNDVLDVSALVTSPLGFATADTKTVDFSTNNVVVLTDVSEVKTLDFTTSKATVATNYVVVTGQGADAKVYLVNDANSDSTFTADEIKAIGTLEGVAGTDLNAGNFA